VSDNDNVTNAVSDNEFDLRGVPPRPDPRKGSGSTTTTIMSRCRYKSGWKFWNSNTNTW